MTARFITGFTLCLLGSSVLASAQSPSPGRFAISVGPEWLGSAGQGGAAASMTSNAGVPVTLFRTESELTGGIGVTTGLAVRLTRNVWVETAVRYHAPRLRVRTTDDLEGADASLEESLQQYQIEAGGLWLPEGARLGRRTQLFVVGGLGYLRQLHSRQLLAESGRIYSAGAGAIFSLPGRQGGTFGAVGLRVEGRAVVSTGGTAFDDRAHTAPAAFASLFLRF